MWSTIFIQNADKTFTFSILKSGQEVAAFHSMPGESREVFQKRAAQKSTDVLPDESNPFFLFNSTNTDLLVGIANGTIDPKNLATETLKSRGLNEHGTWVGFQ